MGIVFRQSLNNTLITYIGFAIGALNTLFLYTHFMSTEYYGLINVILSASVVLMPLLAFGVPNTLVKFYSGFDDEKKQDSFLSLMLCLPLAMIIPIALISFIANDAIGRMLSTENPIVKDYVWYIFLIGMAMAYFEIFYAWARVRMKSVFGNFMKEIFCRVGQTILLILLIVDLISVQFFIMALVGFYLLRTLIMKFYAFGLRMPRFSFSFPKNTKKILNYSAMIIMGGSTAIILLEIDKVMINNFIQIENVAYYSVAGFIAMTIAVPSRAMHQITYPMTAEFLNKKDSPSLRKLYQKSSLTLFIIAGILFLLILLNLNDLYDLLPDAYRNGYIIVFWLGLAKVYDALLGNNNAILYNSDHYRTVLIMGVFLAILAIIFNIWLIPKFGLNGAAIASFSAFFIYNTAKLIYVKLKFDLWPFTISSYKVLALLALVAVLFSFIPFAFHPLVNIALKSILMIAIYVGALYRFKISVDVTGVFDRFFGRK